MKGSPLKRKTPLKRGGRLRPVSKKRAKQNREYSKCRQEYFNTHPRCEICGYKATQIHHKRGRFQERLTDMENFMALCMSCHDWIHKNPAIAYEKGYLIPR
jgi:5-methylcytosine-specific restriction endonuclease McrA